MGPEKGWNFNRCVFFSNELFARVSDLSERKRPVSILLLAFEEWEC